MFEYVIFKGVFCFVKAIEMKLPRKARDFVLTEMERKDFVL